MVRNFREDADCPLIPEADAWRVLSSIDKYLRPLTGEARLRAQDQRGSVWSSDFEEFRSECEQHGLPIRSFWMQYGSLETEGSRFTVTASDFGSANNRPYGPKVSFVGEGTDAARVRGVVAEAVESAKTAQPEVVRSSEPGSEKMEPPSTVRTYTARSKSEIDVSRVWIILDMLDALARPHLADDAELQVEVTDARGTFRAATLQAAQLQWEIEQLSLERIVLIYFQKAPGSLTPSIYCDSLDGDGSNRYVKPNCKVSVAGSSYEAAENLAKRMTEVASIPAEPQIDDPDVASVPDKRSERSAESTHDARIAEQQTASSPWWKRALNHGYSVQIIGGLIVGLIILVLTLVLA